jgi:DNA processing protein
MEVREDQRQLLLLCAIPHVSWNVLAREAGKPGGLHRLLEGQISERSQQAAAAAHLIREAQGKMSPYVTRVETELESVGEGVRLTTVLDDDYPSNLRVIFNLPPFLFYRGALHPSDARSVAVVGTRQASPDGLRRSAEVAAELSKRNVTVLSGLAKGIDTAAHKAALEAGGRTIAVFGTGILRCYPAENSQLAEDIVARGAVVSQFWPSSPPADYNFPRRNVVTSGMGQGTVVIEATSTSGAKMQARLALDHGKQVFLLSDLVTSQPWARRYIEKRGAVEVHTIDDIVQRLRSPQEIDALSGQRRQLILDLA